MEYIMTSFSHYTISDGSPSDDHVPFRSRGLDRILYFIPAPFPPVWHRSTDTVDNVDLERTARLAQLLRIWTAQYLRWDGVVTW